MHQRSLVDELLQDASEELKAVPQGKWLQFRTEVDEAILSCGDKAGAEALQAYHDEVYGAEPWAGGSSKGAKWHASLEQTASIAETLEKAKDTLMKISGTKYKDVAVKLTDPRRIYNDICTIFDLTEAAELNELADAVMATALRSYHEGLLVQLFLTETDPQGAQEKGQGHQDPD